MEYRPLGKTGLNVSVLGFGASPLGGAFGAIDETEGIRAVHKAIDLGINFFDVAPYYGITRAEAVLGQALRTIPRNSYILATKVGRYNTDEFDFSASRVTASIDASLTRLKVDMIDLIHCHDIEFGSLDQIVHETIPALRQAQQAGKVRFLGISGLPLKVFRAVLARPVVDVILSYCRYTLNDTSLANLIPWLKTRQVGIISASPLGMGLLTERGPADWHPAGQDIKAACAEAARHCRAKGVDIAQLALQFSLSNPDVATTLVGIASSEQVETNLRWISQPPDPSLLAEVQAILAPVHNKTWTSGHVEYNDETGSI